MNLFDKNLPVPHVPALHNLLAAITAFGCAAAILTGQSIALADVPPVSAAQAARMADLCVTETAWSEPTSGGYKAVCGDAEGNALFVVDARHTGDVVTFEADTIKAKPAMICRDDGAGRTCETAKGWAEREAHRRVNTVGPKGWR